MKSPTCDVLGILQRLLTAVILAACCAGPLRAADELADGFGNPPRQARLRAYWWWINGYVDKAAITRDLEEMKAKGFGGALICDADGSSQDGNERAPHGPTFFSPAWRELFKHALAEADRLGLEMSLNIQSGWNLGGPMVKPDQAPKKITWSEAVFRGPAKVEQKLPQPESRDGYYRDTLVVAYRLKRDAPAGAERPTVQNWREKAAYRTLHFSAPDTTPLLTDSPDRPGEEETTSAGVVDLSGHLDNDGVLRWDVPEGPWQVLRFGCTLSDRCRVSTCSEGWDGYAIDPLDAAAFRAYWDAVVEPLLSDAGPRAGRVLKYLHTDSWEIEPYNWTPTLRDEFRARRGYDLLPFLPALAGRIVDSRSATNRFLGDFRKTLGDLAIDHHYRLFRDAAHRHGMEIHPESGGPHAVPIDAQQCLGFNDVPMSEFWAWSWRHRIGDQNRFFVKQPASAAHVYGHRLVAAEGFTTIGPHWQETLWDNLKPAFDKACCEGLNLLVWHAFVCSPAEAGQPGVQYFAGTHFNPNTTWWPKSAEFLGYINRCQFMLQRGRFVADACYYYGDHVPNFAQRKQTDPARVLPGYDYDVITEEALLSLAAVKDGRIVLPDGMSYRVLVLPDRRAISLPVLRKVREMVEAGATVVGPRPSEATGLGHAAENEAEVARLAQALWSEGRVVADKTAREVLGEAGIPPDFEVLGGDEKTDVDYIHRLDGDADIYFVASRGTRPERVRCVFRVSGKAPELWDAVSSRIRDLPEFREEDGRTVVPLEFPPCGSWFVVFRKPAAARTAQGKNFPATSPLAEIPGPWQVSFDPAWGGPQHATFQKLEDWTLRPEEGIRYYSGRATYRKVFDAPAPAGPQRRLFLDLGQVRELAEVRLNGRRLGVVWAPPFRVGITDALRPAGNVLEVEVVNFWPNRIIGDQSLPAERRFTRTNIRKLTKDTPLVPSGLLGPVTILAEEGEAL